MRLRPQVSNNEQAHPIFVGWALFWAKRLIRAHSRSGMARGGYGVTGCIRVLSVRISGEPPAAAGAS